MGKRAASASRISELASIIAATLVAKYSSIVPVGIYGAVLGVIAADSAFLMRPSANEGAVDECT